MKANKTIYKICKACFLKISYIVLTFLYILLMSLSLSLSSKVWNCRHCYRSFDIHLSRSCLHLGWIHLFFSLGCFVCVCAKIRYYSTLRKWNFQNANNSGKIKTKQKNNNGKDKPTYGEPIQICARTHEQHFMNCPHGIRLLTQYKAF